MGRGRPRLGDLVGGEGDWDPLLAAVAPPERVPPLRGWFLRFYYGGITVPQAGVAGVTTHMPVYGGGAEA